jgi:hypothetical protein
LIGDKAWGESCKKDYAVMKGIFAISVIDEDHGVKLLGVQGVIAGMVLLAF